MKRANSTLQAAIDEHIAAVAYRDKHHALISDLEARLAEVSTAMDETTTQLSDRPKLSGMSVDSLSDYSAKRVALDRKLEALALMRDDVINEIKQAKMLLPGFDISVSESKANCWKVVYDDVIQSLPTSIGYLTTIGLLINRSFDAVASEVLPDVDFNLLPELSEKFGIPA